jgi:hypothetical protein
MNYFIILFTILLGQFSNAQSLNTFLVKNKFNDHIKKVYSIGDKVTLILNNSVNSDLKVKGVMNEISIDKIKVDDKWIEVSSISTIISHNYFGFLGVAVGAGILIKGISMPKSDGGGSGAVVAIDYAAGRRSLTIMAGVLITATSAITIPNPKKYRSDKFIFKTYLAP